MADYSLMTIDEMETELVRLGTELAKVQDARHALLELVRERKMQVAAKMRARLLTPLEKDALRAVLEE